MGAPAVITVADGTGQQRRFYRHWASKQYQIPYLAEFIHHADQDGAPLTLATYLAFTAAHPDTLPAEDITTEPWHADPGLADGLDYRYTLTLCEGDRALRYTVAERDRPQHPQRMRVCQELTSRADLYVAAARACQEMATTTQRLTDRNGGHPLPGPSPDEWRAEADRYHTWAGQQATAQQPAKEPDLDPGAPPDPRATG